ncbi:MAG: hypothetical protein JXQ96_04495 [Cyclobacteriaceae bacterium]
MKLKIEREDIEPVCPYCEKKVTRLVEVKRTFFDITRVICCPECHKILGITDGATR